MVGVDPIVYQALGAHSRYMRTHAREVLLEGPAGTGKTRCVTTKDLEIIKRCPGVRILWVRKTLVSLRKTVLPDFDQEVARGFPWVNEKVSRGSRMSYIAPNGGEIVLGGMDDPLSWRSANYDHVRFFEAHQATRNGWEELSLRCRRFHVPYNQMTADTNPAHKGHFLYQRSRREKDERGEPLMEILRSRHWMNPKYFDPVRQRWRPGIGVVYKRSLDALTGHRRARLRDGLWVSQSGQVYPEYDEDVHLVPRWKQQGILDACEWFGASVDWGWSNAGTIQVWGFVPDWSLGYRMYLVAEVYRRERGLDWWAKVARMLDARYGLKRIWADPSRPDAIEWFNESLGRRGGHWICQGADNRIASDGRDLGGIDVMRWHLRDAEGNVRMRLFEDCLVPDIDDTDPEGRPIGGPCAVSADRNLATCLAEELPDYIMSEIEDDKATQDQPSKKSQNHGCDGARYIAMAATRYDFRTTKGPPVFLPESAGAILNHQAVLNPEEDAAW